jgi:hypothetical protein
MRKHRWLVYCLTGLTAGTVLACWVAAVVLAFSPMEDGVGFILGMPGGLLAFVCALRVYESLS